MARLAMSLVEPNKLDNLFDIKRHLHIFLFIMHPFKCTTHKECQRSEKQLQYCLIPGELADVENAL